MTQIDKSLEHYSRKNVIPIEFKIDLRDAISTEDNTYFTFKWPVNWVSNMFSQRLSPPNTDRIIKLRKIVYFNESDKDYNILFLHASFSKNQFSYVGEVNRDTAYDDSISQKKFLYDSNLEFKIWFTTDGRNVLKKFTAKETGPNIVKTPGLFETYATNIIIEFGLR